LFCEPTRSDVPRIVCILGIWWWFFSLGFFIFFFLFDYFFSKVLGAVLKRRSKVFEDQDEVLIKRRKRFNFYHFSIIIFEFDFNHFYSVSQSSMVLLGLCVLRILVVVFFFRIIYTRIQVNLLSSGSCNRW